MKPSPPLGSVGKKEDGQRRYAFVEQADTRRSIGPRTVTDGRTGGAFAAAASLQLGNPSADGRIQNRPHSPRTPAATFQESAARFEPASRPARAQTPPTRVLPRERPRTPSGPAWATPADPTRVERRVPRAEPKTTAQRPKRMKRRLSPSLAPPTRPL